MQSPEAVSDGLTLKPQLRIACSTAFLIVLCDCIIIHYLVDLAIYVLSSNIYGMLILCKLLQ